jgi:hypothetical protein
MNLADIVSIVVPVGFGLVIIGWIMSLNLGPLR